MAPEGRAALSMALEEARIRNSTLVVVHNSADEEIAALRTELAATGIPHSIRERHRAGAG